MTTSASGSTGIVCPKCGAPTSVLETRAKPDGQRRRRRCVDPACSGRVTTLEFAVHRGSKIDGRNVVAVEAPALRKVIAALSKMLGDERETVVDREMEEK